MNIEQIRQKAQDENTAPEILTELTNSKDSLTRQYVAGNSNTPIKILEKLVKEFPEQVMNNSVLDLLILENPRILLRFQNRVAENRNTPAETLDYLKTSKYESVLLAITKNPNTPVETLDYLKTSKNINLLASIARHPNTSVETLDYLKNNKYESVLWAIAANSNTPSEILDYLKTTKSLYVRLSIAKNPNTSVKTIKSIL